MDTDNASVTGPSDNVKKYEEELLRSVNPSLAGKFALIVRRETLKEQSERACRTGRHGL